MTVASTRVVLGMLAVGIFSLTAAGGRAEEKIKLGASRRSEYPPAMSDAKVETYKQVGDVALKLYIFSPPGDAAGARRPAIVFFFGGGWKSGSPSQFYYQCRYFASRGMVAIAADYRVASRNHSTVADCVRDSKSAIRWVREHAESLSVDPDRIVASGGSAGGHLAACTGTVEGIEHEGEHTAISSRPNAMVLFNPVLSLTRASSAEPSPKESNRLKELRERCGVEPREISPADLVVPGVPPALVLFGDKDDLLTGARQFDEAMKKAGNRCELDLYEGQSHGFFNLGRGGDEYFRKTVISADKFLASLGYLQGEPTVATVFE